MHLSVQRVTRAAERPRSRRISFAPAGCLAAALLARSTLMWGAAPAQGTPLYGWQNVTQAAPYPGRDGAGLVAYANKLWLLGGWNSQTSIFPLTTTNSVWNSPDGIHWSLVKPNTFGTAAFDSSTDWEGRHMAGWAVYENKLWVIGGDSNQCQYQTDAWSSTDGAHWTQITGSLPWGKRVLFYTVVFDNAIWVMGGQTLTLSDCPGYPQPETFYNDIWRSTDGKNWSQVNPSGPVWSPRGVICGAVVFNGRMWVIGGGTYGNDQSLYNDVWSSPDGVHWEQVTTGAPWEPRIYHDIAVYDGRMWVLGGHGPNGSNNLADVWSSVDGAHWTQVKNTPWLARHAASVASFEGALWLTAGTTDETGSQDDIWKLDKGPIVPIIDSLLLH
jgi:hypothetical protein